MDIIRITKDNLADFGSMIGDDMAENIGRIFYRGLALVDEGNRPAASIVWRYINMENDSDNEAVIEWLKADTKEEVHGLLEAYKAEISAEEAVRSRFVLPAAQGRHLKAALKKEGFSFKLSEGDELISSIDELKSTKILGINIAMTGVYPLSNMLMRTYRKEILRCIEAGRKGVCEDLAYLPMAYFDPDLSSYVETDGEIRGLQLYHKTPSGSLEIKLLIAWGSDYKRVFPQLFKKTLQSAQALYPGDTRVILNRHNESAFLLTEKLFPRGFGRPVYMGERDERL